MWHEENLQNNLSHSVVLRVAEGEVLQMSEIPDISDLAFYPRGCEWFIKLNIQNYNYTLILCKYRISSWGGDKLSHPEWVSVYLIQLLQPVWGLVTEALPNR